MVHLVEQVEVETPSGLLVPLQHQAPGSGVTSAAIRLDGDRLDIEEGEDGAPGPVPPPRPQPVQDHRPIGVVAEGCARCGAGCTPLFQHPAEVLAADRPDDPPSDEVLAELGQAPAAEGQAQGRRGLAGQPVDGRDLLAGEARRSPDGARPASEDRPCRAKSRRSAYTVLACTWSSPAIAEAGRPAAWRSSTSARRRCQGCKDFSSQRWTRWSSDGVGFRAFKGRDMAGPPAVRLPPF